MDFRRILAEHVEAKADLTIATIPVSRSAAQSLGIMQIDAERRIVRFVEKPKEPDLLDSLRLDRASYAQLGIADDQEYFLASMGIYVFNRDVLFELLDNSLTDFGKHIIPQAIQDRRVFSHVFQGYWEDIGTIRSFFEANLDLASELPRFNFFDMSAPIYHAPALPAGLEDQRRLHRPRHHLRRLHHQPLPRLPERHRGPVSLVDIGSHITRTVMMGSDYYESEESLSSNAVENRPRIGIGKYTRIGFRHHRQERPHRRPLRDHAGRQARDGGSPPLLHPRRHRHHPEGRGHSPRHGDLTGC